MKTAKDRLKLTPRAKRYWESTITPGVSLGYRRTTDGAGTWGVRVANGDGTNWSDGLGFADDFEQANGRDVLSYEQAYDKARKAKRTEPDGRLTVARAIDEYAADNSERLPGNVSRVRHHLDRSPLLRRDVTALTVMELSQWRDSIKAAPSTINRTIRILKAVLTGAAERYPDQVININAWKYGLKQKPHSHAANNVVLSDDQVRNVIDAAYDYDQAFGLYVEVGAVTGARPSQIVRLEVRDLQSNRLMMPTSRKGTGSKPRHIAVPITLSLAAKLKQAVIGRGPSEPLLRRSDGDPWYASNNDHRLPFERVVERAGLAQHPKKVTFYALRHSSIVRRIKANKTSLRTIAAIHDTSVVMIERNYSRDIDQYDDSAREGLLEMNHPREDNVVALKR